MGADGPSAFRVEVRPEAREQLREILLWMTESSPANASLVYDRISKRIAGLAKYPRRHQRAPHDWDGQQTRYFVESSFRVEYTITKKLVLVVHIEHAARQQHEP